MFEFANNQHNQPKHISDAELLELIKAGELVMTELDTPSPRLFHRGREVKAQLITKGGRNRIGGQENTARWRFQFMRGYTAKGKRRQRRVMRSKLVWMFDNLQLVPDDCLIDHDNNNRLDDSRQNVKAKTHAEHSEKHYGPACDDDF